MDSMQASLENEAKGRAELMKIKKKLEQDINELEINLGIEYTIKFYKKLYGRKIIEDQANRNNADLQKNSKKYQEQIKEIQSQLEDEIRMRDELGDKLHMSEKRCNSLMQEREAAVLATELV